MKNDAEFISNKTDNFPIVKTKKRILRKDNKLKKNKKENERLSKNINDWQISIVKPKNWHYNKQSVAAILGEAFFNGKIRSKE